MELNKKVSRRSFLNYLLMFLVSLPVIGWVLSFFGCGGGGPSSGYSNSEPSPTCSETPSQQTVSLRIEDIRDGVNNVLTATTTVSGAISMPQLLERLYQNGHIQSYVYGYKKFSDGMEGEFLSEIDQRYHFKKSGWVGFKNSDYLNSSFADLKLNPGDQLLLQFKNQ